MVVATPAGFEPATFSLEGNGAAGNFNAILDKTASSSSIEFQRLTGAVRTARSTRFDAGSGGACLMIYVATALKVIAVIIVTSITGTPSQGGHGRRQTSGANLVKCDLRQRPSDRTSTYAHYDEDSARASAA